MVTAKLIVNLESTIADQESRFAQIREREFPDLKEVYLNTGSCGRKPQSVLRAIRDGWDKLNINPTIMSFVSNEPQVNARRAAAHLLNAPEKTLMLTANPTQGMQFILSNLLREGDEFVTTNKEHGSVTAIARWLQEQRGVTTKRYALDAFEGSEKLCDGLMNLVSKKTKVVLVSEIGSYNGWRPNLVSLQNALKDSGVELLVDGAHAPGQGECRPAKFRFWVGSGHKWLGGPNGTAFLTMPQEYVPEFQPLLVGDQHFLKKDENRDDITRFECQGTSDVVKWLGLSRACELFNEVGSTNSFGKQMALAQYFRSEVERLTPEFRTPDLFKEAPAEASSMVVAFWPEDRLKVPDLREALWERHKIWVQPDFANDKPATGVRVSCHWANSKAHIDALLEALTSLVRV